MARNRIIYASQSVWANGEILYRVQSLGSTTTFTSEDIFELGHLDIIDVVDDVPAVAVTLNTNDFGDVKTLAVLAQVVPEKAVMAATATSDTGNLVSGSTYLHGVSLADFAIVCGNLPGITLWAPVQDECDLGTLADNIDQTLFMDELFVNSLEFSYTTGANATENYGAETDNKMWLLNSAAYVNYFSTVSGTTSLIDSGDIGNGYFNFADAPVSYNAGSVTIPTLSTGNEAFLRKSEAGEPAVTWYDAGTNTKTNVAVVTGTVAAGSTFVFNPASGYLYFPTTSGVADVAAGDIIELVFAADGYASTSNSYFDLKTDGANSDVGALRQGQVEISIIDGANPTAMWRLTGVTISADLTREPLTELGHLGPYDRPLTLPIPITVTVDSTAGDLENWATFAGLDYTSIDDIDLTDLTTKDDLMLMVKVFEQTDEEAGGTGSNRKALTDSVIGDQQFLDGVLQAAYTSGDREYALKTIIVKNLKITDEGMTLDIGANATQTFGFRANNDLFVVKGDLSPSLASALARNAS